MVDDLLPATGGVLSRMGTCLQQARGPFCTHKH